MSDTSTTPDTAAADATPEGGQQAAAEQALRVEVRSGQFMELPKDKADDLIRKGLGFEKKMKSLKDREAELEGKKAALTVGEQLLDLKRRDPDRVARMLAIADGKEPETYPMAGTNGTPASALDPEQLSDAEKALLAQNQLLEQKIEQIMGSVQSVSGHLTAQQEREQRQRLESDIRREAATVSMWDDKDVEYFLPQIAQQIAVDPDVTPEEAVRIVATQDADRARRKAEAAVQRQKSGMRLQTVKPTSGVPTTATEKKYTAQDLKDGTLLQGLMDSATRFFEK